MPIAERRRPPQSRPNRFAGGIEKDTERCDKRKWGRPCGRPHSHRRVGPEGRLTPGVFRVTGPEGQSRYVARRSRRCRFRRGTDEVRRPRPNHPAVPRPVFQPGSSTGSANAGHRLSIGTGRQVRPADCAPSRFQRPGSCSIRRRLGFHSSTARHLAVASSAVPKSLLLSGFYPVHPKSQSPLSMSGRCASDPSRASGARPSYPLSTLLPVDKGG
jgi:hypothetical protein